MPFTPFHFGPGYLIKAFLNKRFHFVFFVWTQVIIDVEVLVNFFTKSDRLHTFFHTYLGSLVALVLSYIGFYLTKKILPHISKPLYDFSYQEKESHGILFFSGIVGVWSHTILDSFMHMDMWPLHPWTKDNVLLDMISFNTLHYFCSISGIVAVILCFVFKSGLRLNNN